MMKADQLSKAKSLGFDDNLRGEIDRRGFDWETIFDLTDKYGPMVLEIIKKLLLGRGETGSAATTGPAKE